MVIPMARNPYSKHTLSKRSNLKMRRGVQTSVKKSSQTERFGAGKYSLQY